MKTSDFLREHDACREGAHWALFISADMSVVWEALLQQGRHEWLMWTAVRPGVFPDSTLRRLACRFVRETPVHDGRTVWDLLTDERSRKAVEVAERYVDGKATEDDLESAYVAALAAHSAADAAAYAAASYSATRAAAHAAAHAAHAAAQAARAAAYAARAAYSAASAAAYAAEAGATHFAAYADAESAQIRMIAELGNPFREEKPNEY